MRLFFGRESEDVGISGTVKQCCVVVRLHSAYSVGPVMPADVQGTNNDSYLAE